ncbi:MAG: hypothetical protein PVH84_06040 [Candidatus Aminicenantes bacterium]|jgi:hypothetical protein
MKSILRFWVWVFLFVGLCVMGTAQAEKSKGQLYFVEECAVKMDAFTDYDAAIKEIVAHAKKHNYAHSWATYTTNEMLYYFVYPIESESEIEALFTDWEEMVAKIGEDKWGALYERLMKPTEYYKYYEIEHLPAHSYTPGDEATELKETPATYWGFCYTKPGHEKSLLEIMGKYVDLYKSKSISEAFESYIVRTGADLPACFYVMRGKTFADLFGKSEKAEEVVGAEAAALWEKFSSHLRKYEYKLGVFRPDLSYMPEQQ